MSKAQQKLELFLYKNKLSDKSFIDLLPTFSSNTIDCLLKDLNVLEKPAKNENIIYIFSDGNAKSNGKSNAKAGYSVHFLNTSENYDSDLKLYDKFNITKKITENPTNNVAELSGVLFIFKTLSENITLFKNNSLIIVTDSLYTINCITKWAIGWSKNNWVNSKKEPVKNKQLIQEILKYKNQIDNLLDIKFKHTFSHTKEPSNKESIEYVIWWGNYTVDDNINKMLNKND